MPPEFRTYEDGELSDWYFGYAPSVHNDCVDDDIYSFDSNGSFNYSWNGTTYVPRDQNPEISFSSTPFSESDVVCDTPRAPWDDNETYSYIVDEDAGEIMLNGFGAFIAISHRANGNDEIDVPAEAPDSITYTYTKLTDDQVMLELDAYTEYWRFTLERVLGN
jgi:hypothetical protein